MAFINVAFALDTSGAGNTCALVMIELRSLRAGTTVCARVGGALVNIALTLHTGGACYTLALVMVEL